MILSFLVLFLCKIVVFLLILSPFRHAPCWREADNDVQCNLPQGDPDARP